MVSDDENMIDLAQQLPIINFCENIGQFSGQRKKLKILIPLD
jgi:hypothetical protein